MLLWLHLRESNGEGGALSLRSRS